ncbi:GntR family transcriptional regulator [Rhizocola hellebori]|uniref:GntR family transcriptional regulator n=1 Tax=Rhizocola hellebori TaxID=1392758 RepID=A0A8J3VKJ4_9ACTN|nr:GntR family transcriptional regulator [Rhizocola hellebori]GIH09146.1 GntR family transcriptional regulator [Rhizocola hellebori]
MELRAVARRSASDQVFDQLAGNILRGEVEAGQSLLSERQLAEVLGVSRQVVREALQRLAHAGFVEVRQGGSTTVLDFKRHGGLNLLAQLLLADGGVDLAVARSIVEARQIIGPEVAALAAKQAGREVAGQLRQTLAKLAGDADPVTRQRVALEFWEALVDGSDSIVFRLMFNSLRLAYEPLLAAMAVVMQHEASQAGDYDALIDAVEAGDPQAARAAATQILSPTTSALLDAIDAAAVTAW